MALGLQKLEFRKKPLPQIESNTVSQPAWKPIRVREKLNKKVCLNWSTSRSQERKILWFTVLDIDLKVIPLSPCLDSYLRREKKPPEPPFSSFIFAISLSIFSSSLSNFSGK